MPTRATATFRVDSFVPQPFDDGADARLGQVRLTKTFQGDLEGTSVVMMLSARPEVAGSGAYVAIERIVGAVHGRAGSFLLSHVGLADRGVQSGSWVIVPDSGTDALLGLRGTGEIVNGPDGSHTFHLDYELG